MGRVSRFASFVIAGLAGTTFAAGCRTATDESSLELICNDDPLPAPAATCANIAPRYRVRSFPRCAEICHHFTEEDGTATVKVTTAKDGTRSVSVSVETQIQSGGTLSGGTTDGSVCQKLDGCSCTTLGGGTLVFTDTGFSWTNPRMTVDSGRTCIAEYLTVATRN